MRYTQPPAKKLRTEEGLGKATYSGVNTDPTMKKKKQSNKKKKAKGAVRIAESRQFLVKNYRGALQEYLQWQGDLELSFATEQKNESNSKHPKMWVSICNANDFTGTGEAMSKKQAVQLAALHVIKEMKLITASEYRSITKAAREAEQAKKAKATPATVAKKTKEELLNEREIDEERKIYTGTADIFLTTQSYGFISIDDEINFKGLTAKKRIYVSEDDIVCWSEEVGLNKNSKVIFKLYKDSMGLGAYEVKNEDGTPIIFEPKAEQSDKAGDAGKGVKAKKKKKGKMGPMIENKEYLLGNFKGALQEYLSKKYPEVKLEYETEQEESSTGKPASFIATCKAVGAEIEKLKELVGTGQGSSKKAACQSSALEYIVKLNLLSAKKHFKIHPRS